MRKDLNSLLLCLVCLAVLSPKVLSAEDDRSGWLKFGVMVAADTVDQDEDFEQYEVFLTHSLPWRRIGETWSFFTHLDMTAGMIADSEKTTSIGSIGPRFGFHQNDGPMIVDIGSRVTLVGDDKLGVRVLDGPVHFSSHARIGFRLFKKTEIGFRLQHMSNAGLSNRNPGLDLFVIDVGHYF